ncbi:MAG: hypothetical protein KAT65_04720 [Methanophagales archaeon]|nr:hypothetical protein [Methanophagales archaeon]
MARVVIKVTNVNQKHRSLLVVPAHTTRVSFFPHNLDILDRERDISSKTEENYEEICSGCIIKLDIVLAGYNN